FQVNTYAQYNQTVGGAAMDASGNFVIVWDGQYTYDNGSTVQIIEGVFGQRFAADGSRLGSEFQINTPVGASHGTVAGSDSGFTVVWTHIGLRARSFDWNGVADGSEIVIPTDTTD